MSNNFNNSLDTLQDSELDLVVGGMDVRIGQVSSTITTGSTLGSGLMQKLASLVVDGLNQARQQQERGGHPQ